MIVQIIKINIIGVITENKTFVMEIIAIIAIKYAFIIMFGNKYSILL